MTKALKTKSTCKKQIMNSTSLITTSWDDGHPLDFKVAELLGKYNLPGTFYIPQTNKENPVMDEYMILALSKQFEIGGHTIHHLASDEIDQKKWDEEVNNCYTWLSELLGEVPVSFCFPKGKFNPQAATSVFEAGFKLARTTELMSIKPIEENNILSTTIQIYEHSRLTYFKHLLKRKKFSNLFIWIQTTCEKDLDRLVDNYLKYIIINKGCLHLWGHSWEIENFGLWSKLESIFKRISGISEVKYVSNKQLVRKSSTLPSYEKT